jgi:Dolichyl-phosphate-mannose-protein mannosyltransferase
MDTQTDRSSDENSDQAQPLQAQTGSTSRRQRQLFAFLLEFVLVLGLTLVTLTPRILLALRLAMNGDEGFYIRGGKIYLPLVEHLSFGAEGWQYNYEHPPLVKLLIGASLAINASLGHPLPELFATRLPSIIAGTLLVVAIYWLGRAPFGRAIAFLAALCLAVSPWLVFFSALALLDMTMTMLMTLAYLLLWHAIRHPWVYLLSAFLIGLAAASKYLAVLAIPGMVLFTAYYFLAVRCYIPAAQRPPLPWLQWLISIVAAPLTFLAADPAIWPDPINLLKHSFDFHLRLSQRGVLVFIAGQYGLHQPHWAILYIIIAKMSAFVTVPAAFFVIFALVQLVRFHWSASKIPTTEATSISFLLIWLLATLGMFSLLNIVRGTRFFLPLAPSVALAGASGLAVLLRYRQLPLFTSSRTSIKAADASQAEQPLTVHRACLNLHTAIVLPLLAALLVGPHLIGLTTVYAAEGYTSEFFSGENHVFSVAYPAYREAVQWLAAHTKDKAMATVGLVDRKPRKNGDLWDSYNRDLLERFKLVKVPVRHLTARSFPYSYLIWPMHLVQLGYAIPQPWRSHIVHVIMGGNTVYCYIMARSPNSISP